MFKLCLVTCLVLAVLQVAKTQEDEATECLQKVNYDRSKLKEIVDDESKIFPEDDEGFTKFVGCFFPKRGYQDENGKIKYDNITAALLSKFGTKNESMDSEIGKQVKEFCKATPEGKSTGQTGIKAYNCVNQKIQELVKKNKSQM